MKNRFRIVRTDKDQFRVDYKFKIFGIIQIWINKTKRERDPNDPSYINSDIKYVENQFNTVLSAKKFIDDSYKLRTQFKKKNKYKKKVIGIY